MSDNKKNLENTLDFYNEKMTKRAVGKLFEEYIKDGEKNYFVKDMNEADTDNPNMQQPQDNYDYDNQDEYGEEEYDEGFGDESYNTRYNIGNDGYNDRPSVRPNNSQDDYQNPCNPYQKQYKEESQENMSKEYEKYMTDDAPADYNKNYSYDSVELYTPRRKREPKSKKTIIKENIKENIKQNIKPKKVVKHSSAQQPTQQPQTHQNISPTPKKMVTQKVKNKEHIDDNYQEHKGGSSGLKSIILGVFSLGLLVVVMILLYKINIVSSEMTHLRQRLEAETSSTVNTDNTNNTNDTNNTNNTTNTNNADSNNQSLQAQIDALKKENEELKAKNSTANSSTNSTQNSNQTNNTKTNTIPSTYTVVKGDNASKISKKMYGTTDYYLQILEANNLSSDDTLTVGQVLKIPQIQ